MSFINKRRWVELTVDCKVGISDSLELAVGKDRYVAHNVITDAALESLRTRYVDQNLQYFGLIRKPNAGWAPAVSDTEASYADSYYTINCGDEPPGDPIPVDMQNSWVESWTNELGSDAYEWGPSYAYVDLIRTWEFNLPSQIPGWDLTRVVTQGGSPYWGRGGTAVASGGSNETGLGGCFMSGHLNGGGLGSEQPMRMMNGLILCASVSRPTPAYNFSYQYQPAPYHLITYLWSAAQFEDGEGNPIYLCLNPDYDGGYEQLTLTYRLRLHLPDPVEQTVGGYSIVTAPYGGILPPTTLPGNWDPKEFPNIRAGTNCAVAMESNTDLGFTHSLPSPSAYSQIYGLDGTGSYYRDWSYRWNPAYANYATGVGRIYHGAWTHPVGAQQSAFCTRLLDKAPKTDLDKLVLQARYSWARV